MTHDDAWTVGRLLNWTSEYFAQRGVDTPRLDSEILLAQARSCRRIDLYTSFEEVATDGTRTAFRELVRRRAEGMPVAYLVGRREFYSMEFEVSPDVLIPRPETELIVLTLVDLARAQHADSQEIDVADVGTGSGVLAVCAARHIPQARVVATDISLAALEVAGRNAARHDVAARIDFRQCDLLTELPEPQTFDFIVSNPPYVSTAEMDQLSSEVRDYEPHAALHAGETGTEVIERLLDQAAQRLRPQGTLLFEISPMIAPRVEQMVHAHQELQWGQTIPDSAGHARVVLATRRESA